LKVQTYYKFCSKIIQTNLSKLPICFMAHVPYRLSVNHYSFATAAPHWPRWSDICVQSSHHSTTGGHMIRVHCIDTDPNVTFPSSTYSQQPQHSIQCESKKSPPATCGFLICFSQMVENFESVFTARCTLVQSAVLRSHVVCLSVRPSVCLSVCL